MKILITSIGKRIQLIQHLKKYFTVIGVDASMDNAARDFVDGFYLVHRINEAEYVSDILDICEKEEIDVMIPLYEREFGLLNDNRKLIESGRTKLMLSDNEVIDICNDKKNTQEFFRKYKIAAPRLYEECKKFPAIVKPRFGMGSKGVYEAEDREELAIFKRKTDNPIVQEKIEGEEYTIDVLCDMKGRVIYAVPRLRIDVRSGEVAKSATVSYSKPKGKKIVDSTMELMECLNREGTVRGPITVQCFYTPDERVVFIEINPRFGGGVPLSFEAGADYGKALCDMAQNIEVTPQIGNYKELLMLRYDMAVFRQEE